MRTDITGLKNGFYGVRARLDTKGAVIESDDINESKLVNIKITDDSVTIVIL